MRVEDGPVGWDNVQQDGGATITGIKRTSATTGEVYLELSSVPEIESAQPVAAVSTNTQTINTDPTIVGKLINLSCTVSTIAGDRMSMTITDGGVVTTVKCESKPISNAISVGNTISLTGVVSKTGTSTVVILCKHIDRTNPPMDPLVVDLESWYKFDEGSGSTAADSSGNNRTATLSGTTWATGVVGNCICFNGSSNCVIPDMVVSPSITITGWMNLSSLNDWQAITHCDGWDPYDTHLSFRAGGDLFFSVNGSNPVDVSSGTIYTSGNLNTWQHVAVVYDAAAKMVKFYVNGAFFSSTRYTTAVSSALINGLHIGSWGGGDRFFGGKMDELRFYSRALSDTEINNLYNLRNPSFTITARAGAGGTISPSGAVVVQQGSNQTFTITPNPFYQISQVTVNSVNQGAITTYTFTNVQANHTISATFTAITGDMVAWWKFDETSGTTASDSSGNGKNGTLNGSCTWVAGKINNAVNIPGGTSYVSVPNSINSGVTNFSISAWVYMNSESANMRIFDFGSSTTSYMEMTPLHAASSGKYQFVIRTSSTTKTVTGTAALPVGSWQFVTVTLSSQTLTLYLNGAQVGQITNCSINPNSLGSTTKNYIGKSQTTSHPNLNGKVNDFRFYKRTLTTAEISALYNSDMFAYYMFDETSGSTVSDSSGNGRNGTANGGYSWVAGKTNNAISLDGSSGYVSLPNGLVSSLNDFSIVTWVKLDNNYMWDRIFDFGTGTSNYMFLSPQGGGGVIRYAINIGGGEQIIDGTAVLPTGSWQHVAVTLSGTTGTLYVNGAQVGQNTSMTLKPSSLGTTTQTWIGRSQWADPYFDGLIDGFRIYARALSSTDISTLYNGGAGSASVGGDDNTWIIIPAR